MVFVEVKSNGERSAVPRALLFNDTAATGHHGCTLVNRQIDHFCARHGIEIVSRHSPYDPLDRVAKTTANLLLINGEGSLHSSSKSARGIATAIRKAHACGLKTALINSIYQENDAEIDGAVKLLDICYVRDERSQHALRGLGVEAAMVPDLSLSWRAPAPAENRAGILVTDSTVKSVNQTLFHYAREHRADGAAFLPLIARPAGGRERGGNWKRRARFLAKRNLIAPFSRGLYSARYRNAVPEFDSFIERLNGSAFLVAGRFHAICLALDLAIPFCAVSSNSWKVEALLERVGMSDRILPLDTLSRASPRELEDRLGAFSAEESAAVARLRTDARESADGMFATVADLCAGRT